MGVKSNRHVRCNNIIIDLGLEEPHCWETLARRFGSQFSCCLEEAVCEKPVLRGHGGNFQEMSFNGEYPAWVVQSHEVSLSNFYGINKKND